MTTIAAGLAVAGKIPFVSSYANFSPGRAWEQARTTICYNNANVKIAGHHAGISVGPDGATHQATEDVAIMRALPNMKVVVPCDSIEAQKAVLSAVQIYGPTYLRFQREKTPIMTTKETPFVFGKAQIFWQSKNPSSAHRSGLRRAGKNPDVLIIGMGPIIYNALLAAKELEKEGVASVVLNNHTVKPLDEKEILDWAKKAGAVVTVEEHNIVGGLGGAVSELLSQKFPLPVERVGIQDVFGESGKPEELIKKYRLGVPDIVRAVKKAIRRK
jgi:transketolase